MMVPVEMFYAVPIGRRLVVAGPSRNRELQKNPLHLLDSSGKVVRSYGTANPNNDPATFWDRVKRMGPGTGSAVWTAGFYTYHMELWDTAGRKLKSLTRDSKWFKPHNPEEDPFYRIRPEPQTIGIQQAGNELWVVSVVAASDWSPIEDTTEIYKAGLTEELKSRFYDSIIEVFDINNGTLLASQRFDQTLGRFVGDRMTYSYTGDEAGNTVYTIWRLKLQR
jgi:hypothetical protein